MVIAFVQVTLKHPDAESYAWMAVIAAPWLVAVSVIGKRVKCPRWLLLLLGVIGFGGSDRPLWAGDESMAQRTAVTAAGGSTRLGADSGSQIRTAGRALL